MKIITTIASFTAFLAVAGAARTSRAGNICNETVPANRYIDGLPAYSQCTDSTSASIWSNNGVDTSTSSGGAGWVRTQSGNGYQCTELARRYMLFRWSIDYQHGNAKDWCDGNLPSTLVKSTTPVHGDLIVFGPNACGADATTGHVAVVDTVNAAGTSVTFVEENNASRRSCAVTTASCFLHATANDGTVSDAGVGDGGPKDGGAAGSGGRGGAGGGDAAGGSAGTGAGGANTAGTGGAGGGGRGGAGGAIDAGRAGSSGTGGGNQGGSAGAAGGGDQGGSAGVGGVGNGGASGAGEGGSAGASGRTPPPEEDAGCSCHVAGRADGGGGRAGWLALALAALFTTRRRERALSRRTRPPSA